MSTYKAVYIGMRRGTKNPLLATWRRLDDAGKLTDEQLAFKKGAKRNDVLGGRAAFIGDVFTINEKETGYSTERNRADRWTDQEALQRWRLEEKAEEAAVAMEKHLAAADYDQMTLAQLRDLYLGTIGRARRAGILAAIIQFVTR